MATFYFLKSIKKPRRKKLNTKELEILKSCLRGISLKSGLEISKIKSNTKLSEIFKNDEKKIKELYLNITRQWLTEPSEKIIQEINYETINKVDEFVYFVIMTIVNNDNRNKIE